VGQHFRDIIHPGRTCKAQGRRAAAVAAEVKETNAGFRESTGPRVALGLFLSAKLAYIASSVPLSRGFLDRIVLYVVLEK
jgi:hypothetical protein